MRRIGGLLGRSPYGPLHEQMVKVTTCVEKVPKLLREMAAKNKRKVTSSIKAIHTLEHEADDVKSAIRDRLSNSLFSSVERSETLHLVGLIDSIADDAEKVAKLVSLRWTPVPERLGRPLVELGEMSLEHIRRLTEIAGHVRDIMQGGSKRADADSLLEEMGKLGQFGFESEKKEIEVSKLLFEHEKEASPLDLVFLLRIIGQVANIARVGANVADAIRRIVLNR